MRLANLTSKQLVSILLKNGFIKLSQKGSHLKMYNGKLNVKVIIPISNHDIPKGTLLSIIKQSTLDEDVFKV